MVNREVRFRLGFTLAVSGLVLSFVECLLWIWDGRLRHKSPAPLGLAGLVLGAQLLRHEASL